MTVGAWLFKRFATMKMISLIGNGFYSWSTDKANLDQVSEFGCYKSKKSKLKPKLPAYRQQAPLPIADWRFYLFSYLAHIFCCFRKCLYREYTKAQELVEEDVTQSLNIVNLFRRLRMHGFALDYLVSRRKRSMLAFIAQHKNTTAIIH